MKLVVIFITLAILLVSAERYGMPNGLIISATKDNSKQLQKDPVSIMYAASLLKTFEENLGPVFQAETGYPYQGEARGSVQIANMVLDGLRRPDIIVSAGTIPIMKLMNATEHLADWLVKFGATEMVIAYSPDSPHFDDLEKARTGEIPWYEVLSNTNLKFGSTDPELDPKGY